MLKDLTNLCSKGYLCLCAVLLATSAWACGTERWAVKTVTDQDAGAVDLVAVPGTIAVLTHLKAPAHPNAQPDSRYKPTELTVYRVQATLTLIKQEADQDYHLVLSDAQGRTMIAEAPDPVCAKDSIVKDQIAAVRETIRQKLGAIETAKHLKFPVTVTGIAFFDLKHGQSGLAENGIELHPILAIDFEPSSQ